MLELEPDYYPLETAAKTLNCDVGRLIHHGVRHGLPIYVLTSKFSIRGRVCGLAGGLLDIASPCLYTDRPYMRLAISCLTLLEDDKEADITLTAEPHYIDGLQNGWFRWRLFHCDTLGDPQDVLDAFRRKEITVEQCEDGLLNYPLIQVKDCSLVIMAADFKRLQEPKPKPEPEPLKIDKPLPESERVTLLKLVIGMAIDSYGYNPQSSRNTATGDNKNGISAKLQLKGINVSDESIRKYLKEAKELL